MERTLTAVGRTTRRLWTDRETQYLRAHYGKIPAAAIAERLGRKVRGVWIKARQIGVAKKGNRLSEAGKVRLAEMAREGYCNRCIGRAVELGRQEVRCWRRRLGLPPVGSRGSVASCQSCVARARRMTGRQLAAKNLVSLADERNEAWRRYAQRLGWPQNIRHRGVQILELLYQRGPQTRRQIAEALGMPWKGARKSLTSNDPEGSYLAHLMARGLVVCLPRRLPQGGQGKNVSLYLLAAAVAPGPGRIVRITFPIQPPRKRARRNRCPKTTIAN